ncbi:hypothetical protein Goari_016395 [Gossypium aridum]|uniref:Uncharacterized protein n=1 Tax=Gossypium aridum TaxID=34290 RepID=A0A7J8WIE8_GOSAI|nr:hypothetical protein [Gossypium aridum]
MPSPPVSVSSPIREVPNDFPFSLLLLLLFFSTLFLFSKPLVIASLPLLFDVKPSHHC